MHYDLNTPVDSVFSAVDKIRDLCILTDQPKSDGQLTNISYINFNKPRIFMEFLKCWNRKEAEEKTFANFKVHICKEYNELKKVGALTKSQSHINPQVNHTQDTTNTDNLTSAITNKLRSIIMDAIMTINQVPEEP